MLVYVTPGLGDTFVPPYGPWAQISCTDCHGDATSGDADGPHASTNKWLLKKADKTLSFEASDLALGAGAVSNTITYLDGDATAPTSVGTDMHVLSGQMCFNCHRADTYGTASSAASMTGSSFVDEVTPTNGEFSRQPHGGTLWEGHACNKNPLAWGDNIFCRNCHVSDRVGGSHGTNAINDLARYGITPGNSNSISRAPVAGSYALQYWMPTVDGTLSITNVGGVMVLPQINPANLPYTTAGVADHAFDQIACAATVGEPINYRVATPSGDVASFTNCTVGNTYTGIINGCSWESATSVVFSFKPIQLQAAAGFSC